MTEALLAIMLIFGSHEMGHTIEAQEHDLSPTCAMVMCSASGESEALTRWASSGFVMEDIMVTSQGGREIELISAAHKITYVVAQREDLRTIRNLRGDTTVAVASASLLLSAFDDLRSGGKDWDARYWMSDGGAPGILIAWSFK